eukprot:754811-Hanusia_phi.AAC.7
MKLFSFSRLQQRGVSRPTREIEQALQEMDKELLDSLEELETGIDQDTKSEDPAPDEDESECAEAYHAGPRTSVTQEYDSKEKGGGKKAVERGERRPNSEDHWLVKVGGHQSKATAQCALGFDGYITQPRKARDAQEEADNESKSTEAVCIFLEGRAVNDTIVDGRAI